MARSAFSLPRIKVCGVRARNDLPAQLHSGLDAVGFVAWSHSPRCVEPEQAAQVLAQLPAHVRALAVMVDMSPQEAAQWLEHSGAQAVQLCGHESPRDWIGFGFPILRRVAVESGAEHELVLWREVAQGFVLDHPAQPGGSGREVDLARAHDLAASAPCLLAGGLSHRNVAGLVERVKPYGVDASSKLENASGRKDPALVLEFVEAAARALASVQGDLR